MSSSTASTTTESASSPQTTTPEILSRAAIPGLVGDLDASDVLECYRLTRQAPLHLRFGASHNTTVLTVPKVALGLRYQQKTTAAQQSSSSSFSQKQQHLLELTLEYGPARFGLRQDQEAVPHVTYNDDSSFSSSEQDHDNNAYFVSYENEAKVYYTTHIESSQWTSAIYMGSLTGAVLPSLLEQAYSYAMQHPRYQPFQVMQVLPQQQKQADDKENNEENRQDQEETSQQPQHHDTSTSKSTTASSSSSSSVASKNAKLVLRSSCSSDFVQDMWTFLARVGVELLPLLEPVNDKARLYVRDIAKVSGVDQSTQQLYTYQAYQFYNKLQRCVHALATGDYRPFMPTQAPSVSPAPSGMPSVSTMPTSGGSETNNNETTTSGVDNDDDGEEPNDDDDDGEEHGNNSTTTDADSNGDRDQADDNDETGDLRLRRMARARSRIQQRQRRGQDENDKDEDDDENNADEEDGDDGDVDVDVDPSTEDVEPNETTAEDAPDENLDDENSPNNDDDDDDDDDDGENDDSSSSITTASPVPTSAPSVVDTSSNATVATLAPTPSTDTGDMASQAQQAAAEAAEAAAAAKSAAHTEADTKAADAAEAAAHAAQKAAAATTAKTIQQSMDGMLSGDGSWMSSVMTQCITNPQYELSAEEVYLYLDGAYYYKLNLTAPYMDVVRVDLPIPQPPLLNTSSGEDVVDWFLAFLLFALLGLCVVTTCQQIDIPIISQMYRFQKWFFSPRHYEDEDVDGNNHGEGFEHVFGEDVIPLSMGGRRPDMDQRIRRGGLVVPTDDYDGLFDEMQDASSDHHGDVEMVPAELASGMMLRRSPSNVSRRSSEGHIDSSGHSSIPDRFSRDPDLVDLPNLISKSKVAVPVSLERQASSDY